MKVILLSLALFMSQFCFADAPIFPEYPEEDVYEQDYTIVYPEEDIRPEMQEDLSSMVPEPGLEEEEFIDPEDEYQMQ